MDKRLRPFAHLLGDLFYNRTMRIIVGTVVGLWVLMMVLGIEVLTSTDHQEYVQGSPLGGGDFPEEYTCWYWTGTGYRFKSYGASYFVPCDVWRWGRQIAD